MSEYRERTLCWRCQNYSTCSWSRGKPVKGWKAEKVVIDIRQGYPINSYRVTKCPEFKQDKVYYVTGREIAEILGLAKSTVSHLLNRRREYVESELKKRGFKLHSFEGDFGWYLEDVENCTRGNEMVAGE